MHSLDMSINIKKSVCMRIGARYNINCSRVSALMVERIMVKRYQLFGSPD